MKFKCIGVPLDATYQTALRRALDLHNAGMNVPARLQPKPNNPVNSKAITFICEVDDKWKRIGYAVTEVLNEVHTALHQHDDILSVRFSRIKYISYWTLLGPGY